MVSEKFIKEVFQSYFQSALESALPEVIKEVIKTNPLLIGQDYVALSQAMRRYNLSRKTLYNYHNRGHITLRSSGGKTFVSISEIEAFIESNPVPRFPKD